MVTGVERWQGRVTFHYTHMLLKLLRSAQPIHIAKWWLVIQTGEAGHLVPIPALQITSCIMLGKLCASPLMWGLEATSLDCWEG